MTTSIRNRVAAVIAGGAVLTAASFVAASPAAAEFEPDDPTYHFCGNFAYPWSDDGPLTDVIHHNVEPLGEPLNLRAPLHGVNCVVWTVENSLLGLFGRAQ